MVIRNYINYDISKNGVAPVIDAVQGEKNSRFIELALFSNGEKFDVEEHIASLAFKKPDGKSGWYDTLPDGRTAFSIMENVIIMEIAPQVLAVSGIVNAVMRIETKDGSGRATTFPFIINVSADPASDAVKSDHYYSVQNWDNVNQAIDDIYNIINNLENMDSTLIVELNQSTGMANFKSGDIIECVSNGGFVLLSDGENYIPLTFATLDYALFTITFSDGEVVEYTVSDDGSWYMRENTLGGSGASTLTITVDADTLTASETAVTVQRIVENGGRVILSIDNKLIPITYLDDFPCAHFEVYDVDTNTKFSYLLWDDGTVEVRSVQIGDIETALDAIIEIQNALIGGDA